VNKGRVAAVWIILAAGLGLAACSTSTPNTPGAAGAPTTTAAAVSPGEQFAAALGKLKTVGFDATVSVPAQGATIKASVDYATKAATETATVDVLGQTLSVAATLIGSDLWMKADLGPLARGGGVDKTKWYRVDPAKLKDDSKPFDLAGPEPLAITSLFASVAGVTRTDATHLTGTVDLTKATGPQSPDEASVTDAGTAATHVPFTATLDDQGRFVELKITPADANKDLAEDITFTKYGSPTAIAPPPASEVLPATSAFYQAINGA
jgi:hypothetical protein